MGSTFGALKQMSRQKDSAIAENLEPTNKGEASSFTDEELQREWMGMCNRMAQRREYIGLATSMRNLQPVITDYPNVEVVVTNTILMEQLHAIRDRIRLTLATFLHNAGITVTLRLAEKKELKPVLSKRELLEKMCKESSQIKMLVETLGLELI